MTFLTRPFNFFYFAFLKRKTRKQRGEEQNHRLFSIDHQLNNSFSLDFLIFLIRFFYLRSVKFDIWYFHSNNNFICVEIQINNSFIFQDNSVGLVKFHSQLFNLSRFEGDGGMFFVYKNYYSSHLNTTVLVVLLYLHDIYHFIIGYQLC